MFVKDSHLCWVKKKNHIKIYFDSSKQTKKILIHLELISILPNEMDKYLKKKIKTFENAIYRVRLELVKNLKSLTCLFKSICIFILFNIYAYV